MENRFEQMASNSQSEHQVKEFKNKRLKKNVNFWDILEIDKILSKKLAEEMNKTGKIDKTYKLFKKRYG